MKDIFKELDRYKSLTSSFPTSEIFRTAELQRKMLGDNFIKSSAIESALKQQKELKEMVGIRGLDSLVTIRPELFKSSVPHSIINSKSKINELLSLSGIASLSKQRDNFLKGIDSSIFKTLQQEQNKFQSSFFKASSVNSFALGSSRLNKLMNNQLLGTLGKRHNLFNNSALEAFQTSSHILSNIQTASSMLKKVEFEKYEALQNLRNSFSVELLKEIKIEAIDFNEAIDVVEEAFTKKIETTPKGLISFEGMLQIFLAFALYIFSYYSALESEEAIMKRMNELEASFVNQIALLVPEEDSTETFYIVKRTVNLRADHTTKSPVLSVLYPNQKVKLIKRSNKWIYVEFFDNLNGIPRLGWVYKKYLKMEK